MNTISTATLVTLVLAVSLVPMGLTANALSGTQKASFTREHRETRLAGQVTDPSGALVPQASIQISSSAGVFIKGTSSDADGYFSINLPSGEYEVTVTAQGFDPFVKKVRLGTTPVNISAPLLIATEQAVVQVDATADQLSTSADANKNGLDMKGDELATLSDDDTTFQQQLLALAGDDGSHPPQVYVDGFSGGNFPPKSAILEVKINENPFSAAYDSMGLGRIEIFTKPGTGNTHGTVDVYGDPSLFNSRNTFLQQEEPSYYRLHTSGTLSGPLNKKTSFFLSGNFYDQQNNAIVNAQSVDSSGSIYSISKAIPDPTQTGEYSARLDRQWSENNTITGRYEYDRVSQSNGGLTQSVLASGATNSVLSTQTLQLHNTGFIGTNIEIDSRFQWLSTRVNQSPVSTMPTVQVSGTVTDGGSPLQVSHDHQDQLEFQEDATYQHRKHMLRVGGRYRSYRDANLSTAGFNGTYTFNNLAGYQATILGTPSASQYQVTTGRSAFTVMTGDLALWAEDEWQPRKGLTANFGVRFESQSAIPDHSDPSPHVGLSWAPFRHDTATPLVVFRIGSGIYYDRFPIASLMTAIRQGNTLAQQTYTVTDPNFFGDIVPPPTSSWVATTYRASPNLQSEYEIDSSASAEFSLGKRGSVALTFLNKVQKHQWVSINANAPRTDGSRPYGASAGNMYEFVSGSEGLGNWFYIDPRIKLSKSVTVSGHFNFRRQTADTFGLTSFASNSYNIHQDYGRSPSDRTYSAYVAVSALLKWGVRTACFLNARAGEPFNITTGSDNNGDSIYNDRPSFATSASNPAEVVHTIYGDLNLEPQAGERIIPVDFGHSAGPFISLQVQASKTWRFGSRAELTPAAGKPPTHVDPPYAFIVSVEAQNLTNTVSPAPPVGVVTSPFFGHSIATSNNFLSTSAANRTITLHTAFSF
jgi:hypothetical protein